MSPRIAYWTTAFEPEMEAIAAEVAILRRSFGPSLAWGLSNKHWAVLSFRRGYCLHMRFQALFRAVTRLLEPFFQLNHIFGSLGDWFFLYGKRRRPTVVTVAAIYPSVEDSLLRRVDRFVVEYPAGREYLERLGIAAGQIRLIFPPVDLKRFLPGPPPEGPFTVLFASSPPKESWLEARGVPQILDAAARRPQMRFRLLWRPWGDSEKRVRQWIVERGLNNVEVAVGRFRDMAAQFRRAHVTAAPFTRPDRFKPAPNSVVESLACGRPVLMSERVGLSDLVREGGAGLECAASGEALAEHLDRLQADWPQYSRNARALAERWFGVDRFLEGYQRLYSELVAR